MHRLVRRPEKLFSARIVHSKKDGGQLTLLAKS